MWKRAWVLIVMVALVGAACSSDSESSATSTTAPATSSTEATTSTTVPPPADSTTTTESAAASADAIVITCSPGSGPDFSGGEQPNLDFEGQSVRCAAFDGAQLISPSFQDADATGSTFTGTTISDARMDGATLVGADFTGATLSRVRLTGADLRGAIFEGAELSNIRWDGVTCPNGLRSEASGGACDLTQPPLLVTVEATDTVAVAPLEFKPLCAPDSGEDLSGSELSGEDYRRADLRCASFAGSTIARADFTDADASAADFSGAVVSETTFEDTSLFGASFFGVDVSQSQFRNANLIGADLTGATFANVRWVNTVCPNGVNSDVAGGTCAGSRTALDLPEVAFDEIDDGDITVRQGDGLTTYTITNDVLFEFDADTLTPEAEAKILLVVASIAERFGPDVEIQVWGHADAIGDPAYNLELSQRRAENVAALLEAQADLAGYRIVAVGLGEAQPLVPNTNADGSDNPENRAKNRRVEIVVRGG
ncbi:MAG TPA: pentapeptide repeat-containing protein [Acidimicrobiia bacterium]|jgi:uncharacterized protein YjbI with pentapeptide repeats|nr:pentapeptide repeat-containing protein [Acidimicrobiia bacterium]